jgi:hypothetical protein
MSKKGSHVVPDPHRGLRTRADFDRLCHVEVQEEVNAFLMQFSTHDPDDHTGLKCVAVNPDGERRDQNQYLCFWHPEIEALRLKNKLYEKPEMTADGEEREAAMFHRFYGLLKDYRSVARSQVRLQEAHRELVKEREDATRRRQEEWEEARMAEEC